MRRWWNYFAHLSSYGGWTNYVDGRSARHMLYRNSRSKIKPRMFSPVQVYPIPIFRDQQKIFMTIGNCKSWLEMVTQKLQKVCDHLLCVFPIFLFPANKCLGIFDCIFLSASPVKATKTAIERFKTLKDVPSQMLTTNRSRSEKLC